MQQTFTYNSSNELVRVDDAVINKTVTYDYDYVGNITSVKTYIYTTGTLGTPITTQNYTYNSQNQRTDLGYDANGNLTSLGGYTFGWTNRRLTSATSENNSISYTYNHNGIRTSKTVNGTTTYYEVDQNNNVVKQYELVNDVETNVIEFVYDSNNTPIYFTYNNATYYYEKNLQGDIVAILDTNGNTVVEYTYDIWGKLLGITGELADTLGLANPLRYRGYYYDSETELYYLQSRYYSPDLMRFISQDDPVLSNAQGEPLGSNLYAYCLNNPVMNCDYSGSAIETVLDVASIAWSLVDLFAKPSWANLGFLVWDIAAALIPFVPGSYSLKAGKFAVKVADKVNDFKKGSKFLTGTYKKLKNVFKSIKGIEIHHLVEKRFKKLFRGCKVDNYLSIPLSKELHRTITNRWRNLHKTNRYFKYFKYGSNYTKITYTMMEKAIKEVYKDMPQLLYETLTWFRKNWRK